MTARAPDCHPSRKHHGLGMCGGCKLKMKREEPDKYIAMGGKIRYAECHPERLHQAFGLCMSCYDTKKYATRAKEKRLVREYGMSLADKAAMEASQGGGCAICGRRPDQSRTNTNRGTLHVDHDHGTGKVRGLLCNFCNVALGLLDDDPERLAIASQYLYMHRSLDAIYAH